MKVKSIRPRSSSLPYNKLSSMMYSVADNIQQKKVTKLSKKENEAELKTTQQTDTNLQQQTRSTLNASLIDTSIRRNSYTPSNASADAESKSIKFKKQRTEEQLLNNASGSCTNCAISGKDEQQRASSSTNQSFLANLRSDIQKFGQKRKPKSNALSTVKKDHQKNRPIRCSSCDILDVNNPKLTKQSSIQSNSSGQSSLNNVQIQSSITTTTTSSVQASVTNSNLLISATCSQVSTSTITQTRSSPIKTFINPIQQTSNKPSPLELNDNSKLICEQQLTQFTEGDLNLNQSSQLLKFKNELINSNIENLARKTSSQEDLSASVMCQHQPAEKRDSNKSSSSTDTTVGSNTNSISVSTTTAATMSGSLGKGITVPFQIDTCSKLEETDDALNPIITITEHSPISSSANQFFIASSGKQQNDDDRAKINQELNFKDKYMRRSLTDTNVCYFRPKETEALGTLNYITKSGQICLLVILRAVHNVSIRENVCTPRVCDGIVNILNELVSLGLLEHIKELERSLSTNSNLEKSKLKYLRARSSDEYSVLQLFLDTCMNIFKMIGCEHGCNKQVKPADVVKTRQDLHALLCQLYDASQTQFLNYFQELIHLKQLNELIDVFHSYLGFCTERNQSTNISRESSRKPGACNKISSGSSNKLSPTINNQSSSSSCSPSKPINENLTSSNNELTTTSVSNTLTANQSGSNATSASVVQTASNENQKNHNNNQSTNETITTNDKKIALTPTSPKPPLSGGSRKDLKKDKEQLMIKQRNFKIEEFIIKSTFSLLIDRLTRVSRTLNHNENLSTYCDIRQMLIFIKTYHSSTFRKTTLSALVESTEQMKRDLKRKMKAERIIQQQKEQQKQQKEQSNVNKEDNESSENVNFYINDEPQPSTSKQQLNEKQNRKSFFKRRNQKTSSSQSITGEDSGNELQSIGASETELPLIQQTVNKDDQLKSFPSNASFTNANSTKKTKRNAYILGMLKSKGEETFYKGSSNNFMNNQLVDNVHPSLQQSSASNFLADQSLSSIQLKSNRGYWFGGKNLDPNNNNQDKQINSDGVFVFSANNPPKDDLQQTKIFTIGGVIGSAAAASLYSGNTLAVAPITEIRRSSFQSRTYLGKHLGFANDFNGTKSIHKARKAVEDQFLKIHLMSKRPGGPKLACSLPADDQQTTNLIAVGQAQQQQHQTELSRKSSLNYLDIQNAEKMPYNQTSKHPNEQISGKEMDIISLKEGKFLTLSVLKNGVLKFSFLLESCPPGSLPDPGLIAAVLSLKAPVIARASFFFELANFVHNCNFGNWAQWMKQNFPILRNSGPLNKPFCRPNPRSLGQNSNLQRYAGRIFYHWAEAIASFLEELLIKEKLELEKQEQLETMSMLNENDGNNTDDQKSIKLKRIKYAIDDDEEEDFLDDRTVNPNGNDCPYALKFAAVTCLTEITQYLRETHQTLKPEKIEKPVKKNLLNLNSAQSTGTTNAQTTTTHSTGAKGFASLAKQILERHDQDKDTKPSAPPLEQQPEKKKPLMTASRRWSMALSNLGLSQVTVRGLKNREDASHSLKENLSKKQQEQHSQDQHSKESSSHSGTHSSSGERRISFVIHEAEGENNSEHSSNTTLTQQDEQGASNQQSHQQPVKRLSQSSTLTGSSRPNLLNRRGTGTQSISGSSGQANQQQQSSGQSSGQPSINLQNGTSGSFKRRSIRLKKDSKSKRTSTLAEDQEDSGEYNGMKRTDSLRSRRKVSGISERSDTSDRAGDFSGDESVGILSDDGQQTHQASQDRAFFMTYGKFTHFNILEQDDQRLCSNMPWFKVVNQLLLSLDYSCKHVNGCSKLCYRRQMRSCSKLIKTVSKIYKQNVRSKDPYYYTNLNKNYEDGSKVMQPLNPGSMPHPSGSAAFLSGNPVDLQKQREKKSKCKFKW